MSNELVEKKLNLPAVMDDMLADANTGFEGVSTDDVAIPYFAILQSMSPQVKKGPGRLEGAEEGDLFNNVSQEIFKGEKGIRVIPCAYRKAWVEWVPRDSGGGFVRAYETDDALKTTHKDPTTGRDVLPNGNHLVTTAYHYVLIIREGGGFERAVISMTSTQLKKSRRWISQQMAIQLVGPKGPFTPPPFSHSYLATSAMEQKDQNTWYGWNMAAPTLVSDPGLYAVAKKFNQDVMKGAVKAATPPTEGAVETSGESENF